MKKLFVIIVPLLIALQSCTTQKIVPATKEDLTNDLNNSIIDGFFENDIKNVPDGTYLVANPQTALKKEQKDSLTTDSRLNTRTE